MTLHETISIKTRHGIQFDDVTDAVNEIVAKSNITSGIVLVFTQHTSCSVFIQEDSEGTTYAGAPLILQDTVNCLEKIIPDCKYEGQYLHPGAYHTQQAAKLRGELNEWCLNTDGHIRSSIMGRSESIPLVDGKLTLGEFGRIYFAEFDQTRERERMVRVQIVGE
ncbi:MAG: secondary thiamine-phosphate synthase enzyme YjbQ [Oscillospiraceae bacterium]